MGPPSANRPQVSFRVVRADGGPEMSVPMTGETLTCGTRADLTLPDDPFIAPVQAVRSVLEKAGLRLGDIDLFELNEAFAAQMLACGKELGLDESRVNVNGGAIALGHPIGASGARVLVTLLYAMEARGARRGLAALCLGGGNAVAMVVERL